MNRKIHTKQAQSRRHWLLAVVMAAGLPVLGVAWAMLSVEQTPQVRLNSALLVNAHVARQKSTYAAERVFIGRVEPARESDVGFELGGKVLEVLVDEGDHVKRAQVLARLDKERLRARHDELKAELAQTQAKLALARITYRRIRGLVPEGAASQQALDDARENVRSLEAAVRLAESRIRTNEVDLEKSSLRAPFDAIVTRRMVDEGRVLATGQPILRLLEKASPEARIGVAGRAVEALTVGQFHRVSVHGMPMTAKVKAVLPVRNAEMRTVDVILTLDGDPAEVRTGDLVRFTLRRTVSQAGFWVPVGALTEGERGLWSTYIAQPLGETAFDSAAGATHRLVRRTVEILHEESDRVFVRGTLRDGDLLVTDGLHRVVPGQLVRVDGPGNFTTARWTD